MITMTEIDLFKKIFTGNLTAYGKHIYGTMEKGKKESGGENYTVKEPVTHDVYKNHLEGTVGMGVIPINTDNKTKFFVLDVDVYDKDLMSIVKKIYENALPLVPIKSKSGGLHIYCFLTDFVKTSEILDVAQTFIPILGLDYNTEVFPKQMTLKEGQLGNWINLPYYNGHESSQCVVTKDNMLMDFSEAILFMEKKSVTMEYLGNFLLDTELSDAPPCLQCLYYEKTTSNRNQYLFSLARYLKSKYGDDFDTQLQRYNLELDDPISTEELFKTIISSHKKKDYSYRCKEPPLIDVCSRTLCKKRKFGIGGEEVSQLNFETFRQYTAEEPYYEWVINGVSMKFFSEGDIIKQQRFRELCFRQLHVLPGLMKDKQWSEIVNTALRNIEIIKIEEHDDMSTGSTFKELLLDFLEHRAHAHEKEEILFDKVFKDQTEKSYCFRGRALTDFLYQYKNFKSYTITEVQDRLRVMGATPGRIYVSKRKPNCRVWRVPFESMKEFLSDGESQGTAQTTTFEVDFKGAYNEQENEGLY